MESKRNLKAYYLNQYLEYKKKGKSVSNTLRLVNNGVLHGFNEIGQFELNDEDITYLLEKYKTTELELKKIELDKAIENLSSLKETIHFLEKEADGK